MTSSTGTTSTGTTQPAATIMAFVSPAPGAGRTNALANIAWILAAAGKRVLILDWCHNQPRVGEFLMPLEAGKVRADTVLDEGVAALLTPADEAARYAAMYQVASGAPELVLLASDQPFPQEDGGSVGLRSRLRVQPFDYVIIDAPQTLDDDAIEYFGCLCDAVVVCAPKRRMTSLHAVVDVVRQLNESAIASMRVLAMPQFDPRGAGRGASLSAIRSTLGPLRDETANIPARRLAFDIVEVPDQPYETYQHVLAVLADDPEAPDTLVAAYLSAARWLSGEQLAALTPVKPDVRRRYLRSVQLGPLDVDERVVVLYPPGSRRWADWAVLQLTHAGARVTRRNTPSRVAGAQPVTSLVVYSARDAAEWTPPDAEATAETYWLLIDGDPPESVPKNQLIDLREADQGRARARLLTAFGLFPFGRGEERSPIRYPGQRPDTFVRVPDRNDLFTGRSSTLERIQDGLEANRRVTLTGGAGIGKSELAREFVHTFGHNYDLVCWLPAQNTGALRAGLTELGSELKVPETAGGTADEVLEQLDRKGRWLLVYDNAESIEVLRDFLPRSSQGHVLITSRDYGEHGLPEPLEVPPLPRNESIALLRGRIPALEVDSADAIAGRLTDLPLALQIASSLVLQYERLLRGRRGYAPEAALRWSVAELLRRLDAVTTDRWPTSGESLGRALSVSVDALGEFGSRQAHLIVGIAELVAFLSPEGVSLRLLRSRQMLCQLADAIGQPADLILFDALDLDQALLEGKRFGLFEVSWGPDATLQMHRAVQKFIIDRLGEETVAVRRDQAIRGLAHYAPTDPLYADEQLAYRFDELQPHLEHTEAWKSGDLLARHWVCMQIRHLFRTGDREVWRSALAVAERAERFWRDHPLPPSPGDTDPGTGAPAGLAGQDADAPGANPPDGGGSGGTDQVRLTQATHQQSLLWRLRKQMCDLHRGLGRPDLAYEIDRVIVDEQMAVLGGQHRATLTAKRGLGGDLRGMGHFRRARANDTETLFGFQATLGEDHPETRMAAHNLAISAFLAGDAADALRRGRAEMDERLRLFGPDDRRTWRSAGWIGTFQRELGQYNESRKTLAEALRRMTKLYPHEPDELAIRQTLSVTYRRLGQHPAAKIESTAAHVGYRKLFGDDHPFTRAAKLNLSIDYYREDELEDAVMQGEFCKRGLEERLNKGHPFIALCMTDLSLFYRRGEQFDRAFQFSGQALQMLRDQLGETHPWTMSASTNHAGDLALSGDLDEAENLQQQTVHRLTRVYGRLHPYTTIAEKNLEVIRAGRWTDHHVFADIDIEIPQT